MVSKLVNATELRKGSAVMIDNAPCIVQKIDISKTGKHGHAKARIEAIGIIDGKKRIVMKPGHDKFEVPLIEKKRGQLLSLADKNASIMDVETFETLNVEILEEVKDAVKDGVQVEYWDIEGRKIIKRVI